jgi:hypothetical protein
MCAGCGLIALADWWEKLEVDVYHLLENPPKEKDFLEFLDDDHKKKYAKMSDQRAKHEERDASKKEE